MCRGRWSNRRAVNIDRVSGMREKRRRLSIRLLISRKINEVRKNAYPTVSPQVGGISPSHMKLPTKAQIAEINRVAGMKTDVATMTGFTKIRSR